MGQAKLKERVSRPDGEARNDERMTGSRTLMQRLASRQSNEIVIAFAGPVGCGLDGVVEATERSLIDHGYAVVRLKLGACLEAALEAGHVIVESPPGSEEFARRRRLQMAALRMREASDDVHLLAEYAVERVLAERSRAPLSDRAPVAVPGRTAYLLDQLKRPEEVDLLRTLYRNLFYLVGVTRSYAHRLRTLLDLNMRREEAESLMAIDRQESSDFGQRLERTLQLADVFVRNEVDADPLLTLRRFIRLLHGDSAISPTCEEIGMYAAYAASLKSACLSRQVGAAIANDRGEILATGCNDVPAQGGGVHPRQGVGDQRCLHMKTHLCHNDRSKHQLLREIGAVLRRALPVVANGVPQAAMDSAMDAIYSQTRLGYLIEFSRAVHAEMDAILTMARTCTPGLLGSTMFTTTFPCHSCARHVVAAGISRVVYIEPYEKSLAQALHNDSIRFEAMPESADTADAEGVGTKAEDRVSFEHFEGIAPRLFPVAFRSGTRKARRSGRWIPIREDAASKVLPEYMDNYTDFEAAASTHFHSAYRSACGGSAPETLRAIPGEKT